MVEVSRSGLMLRESDVKGEASYLSRSDVAAKDTREQERKTGTKWNYH
jgi:hypothetical protein